MILTSLLLYFAISAYNSGDSGSYNKYSYHLRGTKEKILEKNPNYFLIKEIETQKELRNLSSTSYELIILYCDIAAILFVFILMVSFCISGNECCTSDTSVNENFAVGSCYGACICCNDCNCKCSGGGGDCKCDDAGEGIIIILIIALILLVFVAIYFSVRICGKHISRMFSAAALFLLYLAMASMSIYSGNETYYYLITVFSLIGAICNFLGILLPNLTVCKILRYNIQDAQMASPSLVQPTVQLVEQPYVQPATPVINQNVIQVSPAQPMNTAYISSPGYNNNNYGNIYEAPPANVYQQPNDYNNNQLNQVNYQYPAQQ